MTRGELIERAVFDAVEDLNAQLPAAQRLSRTRATPLVGPGATLDSLGLINLIAALQRRVEDAFGVRLTLAEGELLAGGTGEVSSLGGLIAVVEGMLDRREHA